MTDFLVSFKHAHAEWAVWIQWILQASGYTVDLRERIRDATLAAFLPSNRTHYEATMILISEASDLMGLEDMSVTDTSGGNGDSEAKKTLLVRVGECDVPEALSGPGCVDLVGRTEEDARIAILQEGHREIPAVPTFPGVDNKGNFSRMEENLRELPVPLRWMMSWMWQRERSKILAAAMSSAKTRAAILQEANLRIAERKKEQLQYENELQIRGVVIDLLITRLQELLLTRINASAELAEAVSAMPDDCSSNMGILPSHVDEALASFEQRLSDLVASEWELWIEDAYTTLKENTMRKTVVELDLMGYSDKAQVLEDTYGPKEVEKLNRRIQELVNRGLISVGIARESAIVSTTGDGAILVFEKADHAHEFAKAVHEACQASGPDQDRLGGGMWFRIGAATGNLAISAGENGEQEVSGTAIVRAVRLEAATAPGQLLIDDATYEALDASLKGHYRGPTDVKGKRQERFQSWCFPVVTGPGTPSSDLGNRQKVLELLDELYPESQLDKVMILIDMPRQHQPSKSLTHEERCIILFHWAASGSGCGLSELEKCLGQIVHP